MNTDITKLKTIANYARHYKKDNGDIGVSLTAVYSWLKSDSRPEKLIEIDGSKFVYMEETKSNKQ